MKNTNLTEIKKIYSLIKPEIEERLNDFESAGKLYKGKDLFLEMAFCLLTPQSKATVCWNAITSIKTKKADLTDSSQILQHLAGVRFKYKKSIYIKDAFKKNVRTGKFLLLEEALAISDNKGKRDFLVKEVKGFGYKEASHFLRNIGFGGDLAILDRHILKNLKISGIIDEIPKSLTRKNYLRTEALMSAFSEKINIPMSHLDFVFWYKEAGKVFK